MKRFIVLVLAGVAVLSYISGRQSPSALSKAVATGDIVRLHILANSDSEGDQAIKLMVRDAVLEAFAGELSGLSSAAQAKAVITSLLPDIIDVARAVALNEGFGGDVSARMGRYDFPERVYDGEVVPAGEYDALRIVLGDGEGKNWWCVMYPPLCLINKEADAKAAKPVKDVKFQSTLADWFKKLKIRQE